MVNSWFRLYAEFADDPKIQMMSEAMQRRFVMLCCEHSKGVTVSERHRAFHWRVSDAEIAETKALFIENGFMDDEWRLLNWNKRQFISDSSTARTRRYRERKRTSQERHSGDDVTNCDALDTDTDTEKNYEDSLRSSSSSEPKQVRSEPESGNAIKRRPASSAGSETLLPDEVAGSLPLNDGSEFLISKKQVEEWSLLYPAVDVKQALRTMKGWISAQPSRRKTRRGILKFIHGWLSREQDKGNGAQFSGRKQAVQSFEKINYKASYGLTGDSNVGRF